MKNLNLKAKVLLENEKKNRSCYSIFAKFRKEYFFFFLILRFPILDKLIWIVGLLGGPVPYGAPYGRTLAHYILPCDNLPRLLLPREPHPGHRGHELRRAPEEGGGGGRGGHAGGGSPQGRLHGVVYQR